MWRSEQPPAGSGSPGCPDLLRHVGGPCSSLSPLYLSFFEEEGHAIAARLRLGAAAAAEPSPGPGQGSALWPDAAGPQGSALWPDAAGPGTSTPLEDSPPLDDGIPDGATSAARPSREGCEAAAALGPAGGEPRRFPQPAAGGGPGAARRGSRLPRLQALSRKAARRGAGQAPRVGPGRPRAPAPSPGRGGRLAVSRARASPGLEVLKASKGLGAPGTRLPHPRGTKLKLLPSAKSRLQHPSGPLQRAQPSAVPKPTPQDTETETAVKVGSCRQPSWRLSTGTPTMASRSQLRLLGKVSSPKHFCLGSTMQEVLCNTTQELKSNGKADQTWVLFPSELDPGLSPGCGDAVPAEQSAGDQLSQELKHLKNELERVKGELADKTAQCEAYRQTISSLQAQLRAAGICPEDATVEEIGDLGRD